jgi:ankyrin repeat protein
MGDPAEAMIRSACSSDPGEALALLGADPALAGHELAAACSAGDGRAVTALLASSGTAAARTPTGPFGWTPISYACFTRLPRLEPARSADVREVVALLLAAGADPDASFDHGDWRQVPLYGAAGILNDAELTRMLLRAGADPNDGDERHPIGEALYHAAEFADPTCAQLLIEAGTKPEVVDFCLGRALNFPRHAMVRTFCDRGARPSAHLLQHAVLRRRPAATVAALLDAGAPVDEPDERGLTPLRVAVRWGEVEVAAFLRGRGADPDRVTGGDATLDADPDELDEMLEIAIAQGDRPAVRRLLGAGARLEREPGRGHDPLGEACWRGQVAIVQELIARGARLRFPGGGSALGAARDGSRNCHHPEGGPTMQTDQEIPQAPYREVQRLLREAGATE